jgi:alkylation response protein AidB-like acyl-CoA dehydrogenase
MNIGGWVTKTIAEYGTSDQLERYVRRSLLGEIVLCQMFSEPNAGSDAAAITTKGTRVEGGWLVNGQKVWISNAQRSDAGLATVRTDSAASKHYGVTMMLINLRASGVEIRPLRDITGDTPFNEVYFTNVFVSDEEVLGSVDEGWKIARATLRNERVTIGGRPSFSTPATDLVKDAPSDGSFDTELGFLIAESQVQQALKLRFVMLAIAGAQSGAEGNITKLVSGELAQRVADLAIRLTGPLGIASSETIAAHDYLATRCLTIAGGTSEVIRNQIAERTLGLPREPSISSLKSPD